MNWKRTFQSIAGGMVLGGVTYFGTTLITDESPVACDVPTGSMVWNNPSGFNTSTDTVMIFAKKVGNKDSVVYINIEVPTKRPGTYGSPDTNLTVLNGSVPSDIQYEHDALAMLIYADTGTFVNVVGDEDTTYMFASIRTTTGGFSNATYARGQTIAIDKIQSIVLANRQRLQWVRPICYETDTILAVVSEDSIPIVPTGYASTYLSGLTNDYSTSTAYLNGIDDTDGTVLYNAQNSESDRTTWVVPESSLWVFIWINRGDCWSGTRYKRFDTR